MRTTFKAKKTEYMGVVFDSKSEAVFARALHLANNEWVYHPSKHCGHKWDFLVFPFQYFRRPQFAYVGGTSYVSKTLGVHLAGKPLLVEYKPSMPTMSYVENLINQTREDPIESILVWGNPWEENQKERIWKYESLFGVDGLLNNESCYQAYPIFSSLYAYGWGNFSPMADSGCYKPISTVHKVVEMFGITNEIVQEAKSYRFDLA